MIQKCCVVSTKLVKHMCAEFQSSYFLAFKKWVEYDLWILDAFLTVKGLRVRELTSMIIASSYEE